jgi:hypothetical protein
MLKINRKKAGLFPMIVLISALLIFPCISCQEEGGWVADGVIGTDEYTNTKTIVPNQYTLYWNTDAEYIYIGIKVNTNGFVAIGFGGSMTNSDVIFGWVKNGEPSIFDTYISDYSAGHPSDTELNGTNDIIESGLKEDGSYTTMEFKRALNTGDKYDREVVVGSNNYIIWAYGTSDDDINIHTNRGMTNVTF